LVWSPISGHQFPNFLVTNFRSPISDPASAIQEQLGLKLDSGKAQVDVMVIDHVEHPSPN
jgi:uncharacterized protein (TIGR03435 family)